MMAFAGSRGFGPGFHPLFGGIGALLGFLLFFAVVTVVVMLLVKATRHGGPVGMGHGHMPVAPAPSDQALQIVRERLARGEIDAEEYNRVVNALNGVFTPPASS